MEIVVLEIEAYSLTKKILSLCPGKGKVLLQRLVGLGLIKLVHFLSKFPILIIIFR